MIITNTPAIRLHSYNLRGTDRLLITSPTGDAHSEGFADYDELDPIALPFPTVVRPVA